MLGDSGPSRKKINHHQYMKNIIRIGSLMLVTSILTACLSPAQRSQTRQSTRVQERTEHRMENRGW
jgi:hypothetical protein